MFLIFWGALGLFSIMSFWEQVTMIEIYLVPESNTRLGLSVFLDGSSLSFLSSVALISLSVFTFSKVYMSSDLHRGRFHMILFIFVLSMIILIISPDLLSGLIGWDGLGLSSFLLVLFYMSKESYKASMLTFISNRVGDALLVTALILSLDLNGSNLILSASSPSSSAWGVILFLALITKSAQVPFSAWLPAAMAAPTPVSALVHSSTLVTAGIYLQIRMGEAFPKVVLMIMMLLGVLTMFLASLSALGESDMKKIVAFSTLSQLGVMQVTLGFGFVKLAFLHLLAHAFFKALLFISAGHLIDWFSSMQDIRFMGKSPIFSTSVTLVSLVSLCGLVFSSAFFTKEVIMMQVTLTSMPSFMFTLYFLSVGMTLLYSIRFIYLSSFSWSQSLSVSLSKKNKLFYLSMSLLLGPALMGGSSLSWLSSYSLFTWESSEVIILVNLMILTSSMLGVLWSKSAIKLSFVYKEVSHMWFLKNLSVSIFLMLGSIPGDCRKEGDLKKILAGVFSLISVSKAPTTLIFSSRIGLTLSLSLASLVILWLWI